MRTQAICLALAIVLIGPFASGQWVHTNLPDSLAVGCFAVSGTTILAGTSGGVFLSTNNGESWTAIGLTGKAITALTISHTNLIAGGYGQFFFSRSNGAAWTEVDSGLFGVISSFAVIPTEAGGTNLFAGTTRGVFLSTNNGESWTGIGLWRIAALAVSPASGGSGTNLFAGSDGDGIFLSSNSGGSWTRVVYATFYARALAVSPASGGSGTNLFAGTAEYYTQTGGLFMSTNNGISWTATSLTNMYVYALAVSGKNLFAGTSGGVFLSTNNGESWTGLGLTSFDIRVLAVSSTDLYAGTGASLAGSSFWRRPLSEIIASADLPRADLPALFGLGQNYPNPFNPSTTIRYGLPERSHVSLAVYNMLAQQIAVLQNGEQEAGYHDVTFNAANLPSGVYFYRLQAGSYVETRKLCLVR